MNIFGEKFLIRSLVFYLKTLRESKLSQKEFTKVKFWGLLEKNYRDCLSNKSTDYNG